MARKKQGWELGAGRYSRSYQKLSVDKLLSKHEPTYPAIKGFNALSGGSGAGFTGRSWTKQWVEKLDAVEKNSAKGKYSESSLTGGPGGFSNEVSRGTPPSWKKRGR